MARDLILGTAGHIDHGKTSLVKALTGIDCDRLPEEKARGITIDIGFAHLDLPPYRLGIVDVPGHERFIKNMLAGATGIDLALLVVAADDSVMPQTREHLEILRLLGLRHGVIALTKSDLVDDDTREVVELEIRELVQGTFLENAPIIPTSAHTGAGIAELKAAIADACRRESRSRGDARRRRGSGSAWPSTAPSSCRATAPSSPARSTSGSLRVGDEVEWQPRGERVRVRSLAEPRPAGRGGASRPARGDQPGRRPSRGRGPRPGDRGAGLSRPVARADRPAALPGRREAADQAPAAGALPPRHGGGHGRRRAARLRRGRAGPMGAGPAVPRRAGDGDVGPAVRGARVVGGAHAGRRPGACSRSRARSAGGTWRCWSASNGSGPATPSERALHGRLVRRLRRVHDGRPGARGRRRPGRGGRTDRPAQGERRSGRGGRPAGRGACCCTRTWCRSWRSASWRRWRGCTSSSR